VVVKLFKKRKRKSKKKHSRFGLLGFVFNTIIYLIIAIVLFSVGAAFSWMLPILSLPHMLHPLRLK